MGGKFSRDKGQRAERAAIALLQPVVNKVYAMAGREPPELARNLMQSRNGGFDVAGMEWMALEIKHHETLNVPQWWDQTKHQAGQSRIPILMYKKNNVKFRVVMFGYLPAGDKRVRCPVDITLDAFLAYFEQMVKAQLSHQIAGEALSR